MFTDVLKEHTTFILRAEHKDECGKRGTDTRRRMSRLVSALTE
jgi:hypothetical protein